MGHTDTCFSNFDTLKATTKHETRLDCVLKLVFSHVFPISLRWWHLRSSKSKRNSCYPFAPPTLTRLGHKKIAGCEALTKIFGGGVSATNLGLYTKFLGFSTPILSLSMVCPRSLHGHGVLVFSVNKIRSSKQLPGLPRAWIWHAESWNAHVGIQSISHA